LVCDLEHFDFLPCESERPWDEVIEGDVVRVRVVPMLSVDRIVILFVWFAVPVQKM
jgi:hypothetical protein